MNNFTKNLYKNIIFNKNIKYELKKIILIIQY